MPSNEMDGWLLNEITQPLEIRTMEVRHRLAGVSSNNNDDDLDGPHELDEQSDASQEVPLPGLMRRPNVHTSRTSCSNNSCHPHAGLKGNISRDPGTSEEKKPVSSIKRRKVLLHCFIHISPTLITILLLVLNARNVYWTDVNATPSQNIVLQSLQFAVKVHEILMTISIGGVLLHRVQHDLLVIGQVPLGFLTSPYRTSDIRYLFSSEFWGSVTMGLISKETRLRRLAVASLIVTSFLLTLLVGPSSGVAMIPKVGWWNVKNPFGSSTESYYINGTAEQIWPAEMQNYTCGTWTCPSAGMPEIGLWASSLERQHITPSIQFIAGGSSIYRYVNSNSTEYVNGWTATTGVTMRDSDNLGCFWNYIMQLKLDPTSLKRPRFSPSPASGQFLYKPLVQVQCSAQSSEITDVMYPHDDLQSRPSEVHDNMNWTVSESARTWQDVFSPPPFQFRFSRILDDGNNSILGSITELVRSEDQQALIVPCTILAYWVPVKIWLDPKTDLNIHDDSENPLDLFEEGVDRSHWIQMSLSDEWLEMLDSTSFEQLLKRMTQPDNQALQAGTEGIPWRISTILGIWLTDAIARTVSHWSFTVHNAHGGPDQHAYPQCILSYGYLSVPSPYETWVSYLDDNKDSMIELSITIDRYGYAWSFHGLLIKFAVGVLILQTLLSLSHVTMLLHGRWTSEAWSSVGSMLVLALRSGGSNADGLKNIGAGVGRAAFWDSSVGVFANDEDDLEIILESGDTCFGRQTLPEVLYG